MLLNQTNIKVYLQAHHLIQKNEPISVKILEGGLLNRIFLIKTKSGSFVLKQAPENAKFNADFTVPQERIITEANGLNIWKKRTKSPSIPNVLFFDKENFVLVMEAIPESYEMLTYSLVKGQVNQTIARKLGSLLASLHSTTYGDKKLLEHFPITPQFTKVKLGIYHKSFIEGTNNPIIKRNVHEAVQRCYKNRITLVHGDLLPKNILVKDDDFYILDYEMVHFGDPSHDLGTLLAHYLLPAIINYPLCERYYAAIRIILQTYFKEISFKKCSKKIMTNTIRHIAPSLYGRVFGIVKLSFVNKKTQAAIKKIVNTLGENVFTDMGQVFALIDKEAQNLKENKPLSKEDIKGSLIF